MRHPHTSRSLHTRGDLLPRLGGGLWAGVGLGVSVPSLRPQILGARHIEYVQLIPQIRNYPVLCPPKSEGANFGGSMVKNAVSAPQRLSEGREEQAGSEADPTLLQGRSRQEGSCLIPARQQLSLSWFPQLQTKGSHAAILGKGERRPSWILPRVVNSGEKAELKSADRRILTGRLLTEEAHWWSECGSGS